MRVLLSEISCCVRNVKRQAHRRQIDKQIDGETDSNSGKQTICTQRGRQELRVCVRQIDRRRDRQSL